MEFIMVAIWGFILVATAMAVFVNEYCLSIPAIKELDTPEVSYEIDGEFIEIY